MGKSIQIVFDAADPAEVAAFWAEALGYVLQPPPAGYETWEAFADEVGIPEEERNDLAAAIDPDGVGPRVLIQKVPEGKAVKNRVHLDIAVDESLEAGARERAVDAESLRLQAHGASVVEARRSHGGTYWVVMQDPEGNEFCVH